MVNLTLAMDDKTEYLKAKKNENILLPRPEYKDKTFLGWVRYKEQNYTFMNISADADCTLYPRFTSGPAYLLKSYFRGVQGDSHGKRCQFRRYVIDVYLKNAVAKSGEFKLENVNHILYYFGNLPIDGVDATVDAITNQRGGAYNGTAYFTTSDITVKWQSEAFIDAAKTPQKVATLLLCFGRWGMSYNEIEKRTSDEIIMPAPDFEATADGVLAKVSANFYSGIVMEENISSYNPALLTVKTEEELPDINFGLPLSRFALLSDSHVGERYGWQNYNWLYGVFEHLEKIHNQTPLDFVLQLGDNIDDGYAETYMVDYKAYLDAIKKLTVCDPVHPIDGRGKGKIPHYELQGNHDTSLDTRFFRNKLWYSERADGQKIAFIAFFTNYGGYPAVRGLGESYKSYGILTNETVAFVEKAITEAEEKGAKHIVLCSHFGIAQDLVAPILPETGLGKIEQLCKKHNIKLYLNGHEHNKDYALRSYNGLYDYDAAMTRDKYAVFEIYQKYAKVTIYNTGDNSVDRIDVVSLC